MSYRDNIYSSTYNIKYIHSKVKLRQSICNIYLFHAHSIHVYIIMNTHEYMHVILIQHKRRMTFTPNLNHIHNWNFVHFSDKRLEFPSLRICQLGFSFGFGTKYQFSIKLRLHLCRKIIVQISCQVLWRCSNSFLGKGNYSKKQL